MIRLTTFISYIIALGLLSSLAPCVFAQELPGVHLLQEVEIREDRISTFSVGAKSTIIDSAILKLYPVASIAEILNDYSTTHIKSYGSGMLSTISFRGTGPEHTAVLWHGVNISYPMLGQSDFSLLPLALNDKLVIEHGTASSLYGTGALGGTIALSSARPSEGFTISTTQWAGSFGTFKNNSSLSFNKPGSYFQLKAIWDRSDNDFPFKNSSKSGTPREQQSNASYQIGGIAFESGVNIGKIAKILVSAQFIDSHRQLQQGINVTDASDWQDDTNLRLRGRYEINGSSTDWFLQYAYIDDRIIYNGDPTNSHQHAIRTQLDKQLNPKMKWGLGAEQNFVGVEAQFYKNNQVTESRTNLWSSFLYIPAKSIMFSVNFRQAFHPVYKVPFTPSAGVEFNLKDKVENMQVVSLRGSRGFRIPTLNELYWEPGGNLDLRPEDSYSIELGYRGEATVFNRLTYSVTGYRMWVTDWILWRPNGAIWSPENIKNVDVYGLEVDGSISHNFGELVLKWQGNYAFTRSINRTGTDQFDRSVNKQLSYTPVHKGGLNLQAQLNAWSFLINTVGISKRYITADNEDYLPAYALINLRCVRRLALGPLKSSIYLSVNNILNSSYQSVSNRVMPGVNFMAGINITYHKP